jgi:hypothetical protein
MQILSGKFKRRTLVVPRSTGIRPTTGQLRETLFNICQLSIEGASFLDVCAGSGAIALEALSRGARHATLIERDRTALAAIRKNITTLGVEQMTTLYDLDAFKALHLLSNRKENFDLCGSPLSLGFRYPATPLFRLTRFIGRRWIPFYRGCYSSFLSSKATHSLETKKDGADLPL